MTANEVLQIKGIDFIKSVLEKAPQESGLSVVIDMERDDYHNYVTADLWRTFSTFDGQWHGSLFSARNGLRKTVPLVELARLLESCQ